jgi:hypothetical protein
MGELYNLIAAAVFSCFCGGPAGPRGGSLAASRLNAGRGKISEEGRRLVANSRAGGPSGSPPSAPLASGGNASLVVTAARGAVHVFTLSWLDKIKRRMGVTRDD